MQKKIFNHISKDFRSFHLLLEYSRFSWLCYGLKLKATIYTYILFISLLHAVSVSVIFMDTELVFSPIFLFLLYVIYNDCNMYREFKSSKGTYHELYVMNYKCSVYCGIIIVRGWINVCGSCGLLLPTLNAQIIINLKFLHFNATNQIPTRTSNILITHKCWPPWIKMIPLYLQNYSVDIQHGRI